MSQQMDLFANEQSLDSSADHLGISGLTYRRGLLSVSEQERILAQIDQQPWRKDLKRRVQHYGYRYDYKARRVDSSMYLGPLPSFVIEVAQRLLAESLLAEMPDQAIVNEYLPGQGISAHVDCEPCFKDTIAMVSFGWAYEMEFSSVADQSDLRLVLLDPGSALVMQGDARYKWRHQIKARKVDRGIPRKRRVSLTLRSVILNSCSTGIDAVGT